MSFTTSDIMSSSYSLGEMGNARISGNVSRKRVVLIFLRCVAREASCCCVSSVGNERFRRVSPSPHLESPSSSRRILLRIFHHHRHRFFVAFDIRALFHRKFVNVISENGSVRIRKRAALFQRRQSLRIHINNVHTADLVEHHAVFGHDHRIHHKPIPEPIWERNFIACRHGRNRSPRQQNSNETKSPYEFAQHRCPSTSQLEGNENTTRLFLRQFEMPKLPISDRPLWKGGASVYPERSEGPRRKLDLILRASAPEAVAVTRFPVFY